MDNGSLRPDSVLALRALAQRLSGRLDRTVMPVSLAHVDRIDADRLHGEPAQTVGQALEERIEAGDRGFIILPLLFGESGALTGLLPRKLDPVRAAHPDLRIELAEPLFPLPQGEPRLADLLAEHARLTALQAGMGAPRLCLVDHGSPSPQVSEVRHRLATLLAGQLGQPVAEAAMERRAGAEYDFNGEPLAEWLERQAGEGAEEILLLLLFFLPGRHAGEGGDIETILHEAMRRHPRLRIAASPLVGEHPLLVEILLDRLQKATARFKLASPDC